MTFDFAKAKALVRKTVQAVFGIEAFYYESASVDAPIRIRARLHNQISRPFGDLTDGAGYSEAIEGIDRIVLIPRDEDGNCVEFRRTGYVTMPSVYGDARFVLDLKEPSQGPLEESWKVTRE